MTETVENKENKNTEKRVIATLTISHMAQHLFAGAPILYQSIKEDPALNLNYTQVGLMVAAANILGGLLQIGYSIAGRIMSRRMLLGASNFFMSAGCFFTGIAARFESVLGGNVVAGVGTAGTHPVSASIISDKWNKKSLGSALSIFYGLGYMGNIISPLLLSSVAAVAGWRISYQLLAVVLLVCGVVALVGLRGEPAGDRAVSKQSHRNLLSDIKSALSVKGAVLILLAQIFISGGSGMGVMTTWVPVFLRDSVKGLSLDVWEAGLITSVATIGGVVGTIYLGKVADKRGYIKTSLVLVGVTTVAIYLLTLYGAFSYMIVPHLFILSMTTFPLSSLLQAYLASVSNPAERDILIGLYFTLGFGLSSLWSTLLGSVVDIYSFGALWIVMAATSLGAVVCLLLTYRGSKTSK